MKKRIILTIAAIAIFAAGYCGIFEKKKEGYDNYAFKGDPVYSSKGYDNDWGASDYNDPGIATGKWDYTDSGVTYYK
jgi:hypothetical protein